MNRQYRQIVKYTGYFGGVQGLNILAALVRNKVVAVLLGPIGLGLISLYNTAVKLIGDTTILGIPVSSVRYLSECQEGPDRCRMVATVRLWSLLTAALGAVVCCVLVPFFRLFYFSTEMSFAEFLWLVPVVALTAVTAGELSILKGLHRMREVAIQSVVNAMLSLVVTLPLFCCLATKASCPRLWPPLLPPASRCCGSRCECIPTGFPALSVKPFQQEVEWCVLAWHLL